MSKKCVFIKWEPIIRCELCFIKEVSAFNKLYVLISSVVQSDVKVLETLDFVFVDRLCRWFHISCVLRGLFFH